MNDADPFTDAIYDIKIKYVFSCNQTYKYNKWKTYNLSIYRCEI